MTYNTDVAELRQAFNLARAELGWDMDVATVANDDVPRFRYFQKKNGPMFSWTTQKFDGRYASFVHVPVSDVQWVMDDDSISSHKLRKDAKARALRLYRTWCEGDAKPW